MKYILVVLMLAGCMQGGDNAVQSEPTLDVDIVARFTATGTTFKLHANEPLPDDLRVTLKGQTGAVFEGSDIKGLGSKKGSISVDLTEGLYTIDVFTKGHEVGTRTFTFHEEEMGAPTDSATGHYVGTMETGGADFDMEISMSVVLEMQGNKQVTTSTGSGSMTMEEDGFAMDLTMHAFGMTEIDGEPSESYGSGTGTWEMTGEDSGSGEVTKFEMGYLGKEWHRDASGDMIYADKERFIMEMDGTMQVEDQYAYFEYKMDELGWYDPDTEEQFWTKGSDYTLIELYGEPFEDESEWDEAYEPEDEEDAEPDLEELLPETGAILWPMQPGDTFVHFNDDISISYSVSPGQLEFVGNERVDTLKISGLATKGASGSITVILVDGGDYDQLPLRQDADFTKGKDYYKLDLDLASVS